MMTAMVASLQILPLHSHDFIICKSYRPAKSSLIKKLQFRIQWRGTSYYTGEQRGGRVYDNREFLSGRESVTDEGDIMVYTW